MFKHLMLSDLQQHKHITVYYTNRIYVLQYIQIQFIFKWEKMCMIDQRTHQL